MHRCVLGSLLIICLVSVVCVGQDTAGGSQEPTVFKVADDYLEFTAPAGWEKVKPRSNMLAAEFSIPKIADDPKNGRLTIMAAGGGLKANIDRWIGQFKNADGSPLTGIKPTTTEVAGQTIHMLDISGTFAESMGGPFGPKTDMPNYRMLGSIIETPNHGKYFIKFYGPKPTIDANADMFKKMMTGMKVAGAKTAATEPIAFQVAGGNIHFSASDAWKKIKPRSGMLEAEFQIPKVDGDKSDGRLTIMGAGGSVDANIARWMGQFKTADGDDIADVESKTSEVAGQTVHWVDISGTFADSMGGPQGPTTDRDDYRMLAAIIETESYGLYFVKFYAPEKTVAANEKAFEQLIQSLKIVE